MSDSDSDYPLTKSYPRYHAGTKQKSEVSKYDTQGNLECQTYYDIHGNKIAVSHYGDTGLIRREAYDSQGNLVGIYHYDDKGKLVKHVSIKLYL